MHSVLSENEERAIHELARRLDALEIARGTALTQTEIWEMKLKVCKEFNLGRVPKNSEILSRLSPLAMTNFRTRLRRRGVRTKSGVAVITSITMPFDCPHGTCTFCPGGVRFGTPQSYTKNSPAAVFGIARGFDPHRQVHDSLSFLRSNGHDTSKVELILLGGTILAMPQDYQENFVRESYDAMNEYRSSSLSEAIKNNESAPHRCVGLTIETKPDWCKNGHIDSLLSFGCTRVEIGVQSLQDEVLKATNRGHTVRETVEAFQISRDSSFKIVAHMMPGLPKSDPDRDLEDLLTLIHDEKFKPDMLKIYPTLIVQGTTLYRQFKMGLYKPYPLSTIIELLRKFKRVVPPWVRIMRIQREIPDEEIFDGVRAGNLRQLVLDEMNKNGERCLCIRCREIGHVPWYESGGEISLKRIDYTASGGHEIFLSFEDSKALHGFLRLRIPSGREHRFEIKGQAASLVRELHVYGPVVPIGQKGLESGQSQHRGLGTRLLEEAERISREEFNRKKQIVISASGTKEYYRRRGYSDDGAFVSKVLA